MRTQQGNILDVKEGVIIQQVNAQGVMGSGVAKALRDAYPLVWEIYTARLGSAYCQDQSGARFMGEVLLAEINENLIVASIVGQQFFGKAGKRYTSYDALDRGFSALEVMFGRGDHFHHPLIGAGLGGGNWSIIKSIIHENVGETTLWVYP